MANGLSRYAKNLIKSTKFAAVDVFKETMPNSTGFLETNNDLFRDITATIRSRRIIFGKVTNQMKQSKIFETVDEAKHNILEDIRTGKLYNKDPIRERRINKKSGMDSLLGDMDNFDDFDFDFGDDGGFDFDDDDNANLAFAFDDSSRASADMIATTVAATSANQIQANRVSSQLTLLQLQEGFSTVNSNLGSLSSNIAEIGNTINNISHTNAENSKTYYEKSTEMQANIVSHLKEILDIQKKLAGISDKKRSSSSSDNDNFSGITTVEGMPNLSEYGKMLKSKLDDKLSVFTGMNSMMGDNTNMSMQFAMSPLSFIPKALVRKIVGNSVTESAKQLDDTLSNIFGTFISSMNEMSSNAQFGSIKGYLGDFLGMNTSVKNISDIETKYNKEVKPWNGKAEKALTDVIPTLLAKILAVQSGSPEMVYNYDRGKFTTIKKLKEEITNREKNEIRSSFYDIRTSMDNMMSDIGLHFENKESEESFKKDYDRFFEYFFKSNNRFAPNKKSYEDYYDLGISKDNYQIIEALFERLDPATKMSMDKNKLKGRDSLNSFIDSIPTNNSVYQILNNGSSITDTSKFEGNGMGSLNLSKDANGHNVFWYLEQILKALTRGGNGPDLIKDGVTNVDDTPTNNNGGWRSSYNHRYTKRADGLSMSYLTHNRPDNLSISGIINSRLDISEEAAKLEEEENTSIIDDLLESPSLPTKARTLFKRIKGTNDGVKNGVSGLLNTVNLKIYQAMYGNKKYKGKDVNGIIGVMMENIQETFTKFNTFLDEKILNPLKEKLDANGGIKGIIKKTFGIDVDKIKEKLFGKDSLYGRTMQSVKDTFKGAWDYSKGAFVDTYKEIYDKIGGNQYDSKFNKIMNTIRYGKKNVEGGFVVDNDGQLNMLNQIRRVNRHNTQSNDVEKEDDNNTSVGLEGQLSLFSPDEQEAIKEAAKNMKTSVSNITQALNDGSIDSHDKGGFIRKTKIAMIHEGEEVITKEEKERRDKEEAYKKRGLDHMDKLRNALSGKFDGELSASDKKLVEFLQGIDSNNFQSVKDSLGADFKADTVESLQEEIIQAVGYKKGQPTLVEQMRDTATGGINKAISVLFGGDGKDEFVADDIQEKGKAAMKDIMSKFKQYLPAGISGGLLGTIAGGVIGMPMVGAAIGSSLSIIKKSDKLQEYLFGDLDDEGNRIGNGKLPTKFVNALNQYGPDMKKYGVTGAITSLLPFIPGGPVAGLIIGAGAGFAKNNAQVQDFLFGEMGIMKGLKGSGEKLKKALPKMGLGAAALSLTGPFGLVGNALLGAGIGFATETTKFQEFMYGKDGKDEDGNPIKIGGFLPMVRDRVINPIKEFGVSLKDKFQTFVDEQIRQPFKKAMGPFVEEFKNQGKALFGAIKDTITGTIDNLFTNTIGKTLNELIEEKIVDPISGFFKKLFGVFGKVVGGILKFPAKVMGGMADSLRIKHIKQGKAGYMSEEELAELKENRPFDFMMATHGDRLINNIKANGIGGLFGFTKNPKEKSKIVSEDSKKVTFRDRVSGIVNKGLDNYETKRKAIAAKVSSEYGNMKDSIRNSAQNLKTKAYMSASKTMDNLSNRMEAGAVYNRVVSREPETESEGESRRPVSLRKATDIPQNKVIKVKNAEIDMLRDQIKEMHKEIAVLQVKGNNDDQDGNGGLDKKTRDYIHDIRNEVYGQLDGIGYNVHTIANVLVEQFGMPEIKAKGAKVSRGNLRRKAWFERMFGFILNPARKVKEGIRTLFWGKDGYSGILGTPMKLVRIGFEKLSNIGTLIGKGLGHIVNIGGNIIKGFGVIGSIFKDSIAALAPAFGELLKGTAKLITLPIKLLSGAMEGLGHMMGGLAKGIGILGGKMIEMVSLIPSLVTNLGKLTIEVGKLGFKIAKTIGSVLLKPFSLLFDGIFGRGKNKNKKKTIEHVIKGGYLDNIKQPVDINGAEDRHNRLLDFFKDKFDTLFNILRGEDKELTKKVDLSKPTDNVFMNSGIINPLLLNPIKPELTKEELANMPFPEYIREHRDKLTVSDLSKYADARAEVTGFKPIEKQEETTDTLMTEFGAIRYDRDASGELRPIKDRVFTQYQEKLNNKDEYDKSMFNLINTGDAEDDNTNKKGKKTSWISKIASNIGSILMGGTLLKVVGAGLMAGALYDFAKNGENSFAGKAISLLTEKVIPAFCEHVVPVLIDGLINGVSTVLSRLLHPEKYNNPDKELKNEVVEYQMSNGNYMTESGRVYNAQGDLVSEEFVGLKPADPLERLYNNTIGKGVSAWADNKWGEDSFMARLFSTNRKKNSALQKQAEAVSHKNTSLDKEEESKVGNLQSGITVENFEEFARSGKGKAKYGLGGTFYSQNDPRWANVPFNGVSDTERQTIADSGCGPVAAAMVANNYSLANPVEASQYALSNGYKEQNGGTEPGFFKDYFAQKGIDSTVDQNIQNNQQKKQNIVNNLKQNRPVVLMGKSRGGNTPYGKEYPHYVVATGMRGNNIVVNDPYSSRGGELYNAKDTLNSSSVSVTTGKGKRFGRVGTVPSVSTAAPTASATLNDTDGSLASEKTAFTFVKDLTTTFTSAIGEIFGVDLFGSSSVDGGSGPTSSSNLISGSVGIGSNEYDVNVVARVIDNFFRNSKKLYGKGAAIVHIAQTVCHTQGYPAGIDPLIFAAVIMQETGGNSKALNEKNNPGGMMDPKTNWSTLIKYDTVEEGLTGVAKTIHRIWVVEGKSNIASIGAVYCPVGAANDPKGLNKHWVPGVTKFYNQLLQEVTKAGGLMSSVSAINGANSLGIKIAKTAISFIGKGGYKMGGTNLENGPVDCSGFVQGVYSRCGVSIPRTAAAQEAAGDIVTVGKQPSYQAQAGDIIFFQGTYKAGVSHVGICTGNGDEFIESGGNDGTKIRSAHYNNGGYNTKHFHSICRHKKCMQPDKPAANKTTTTPKHTSSSPTTEGMVQKSANNFNGYLYRVTRPVKTTGGKGKKKTTRIGYIKDINSDAFESINYGKGINQVKLNNTYKNTPLVHKNVSDIVNGKGIFSKAGNIVSNAGKAVKQVLVNNTSETTNPNTVSPIQTYSNIKSKINNTVSTGASMIKYASQQNSNTAAIDALMTSQNTLNTQVQNMSNSVDILKSIYQVLLLMSTNGIDIKNLPALLKAVGGNNISPNILSMITNNDIQSPSSESSNKELVSKFKELSK